MDRIGALFFTVLLAGFSPSSATAQAQLELDVNVRRPRPERFYILGRRALPELRADRLPGHARASWARFRTALEQLDRRIHARALALRALDERWTERLETASSDVQDQMEALMREEREQENDRFSDIEALERAMESELLRALSSFRRAHPEHGLAQLALAELELLRASIDFGRELEGYEHALDAGEEAIEPPESPAFERAIAAAERASTRLRGSWRAWALYAVGFLALEVHDDERASSAFAAVLDEPRTELHSECALRLAERLREEGRWGEAITLYERAIAFGGHPETARLARYQLTWSLIFAARWTEARDGALMLLDEEGEAGLEVQETMLPLTLAGVGDDAGATLPHTMLREQRSTVLLSLARLQAERLGDRAAARVGLEAAVGLGAPAHRGAIDTMRERLDQPMSNEAAVHALVFASTWACQHGQTDPATFVASGRVEHGTAGFTQVTGGGASRECLMARFGSRRRGGQPFRVRVR